MRRDKKRAAVVCDVHSATASFCVYNLCWKTGRYNHSLCSVIDSSSHKLETDAVHCSHFLQFCVFFANNEPKPKKYLKCTFSIYCIKIYLQ